MSAIDTVLLDRDGVINHDSPDYIKSPEEWQPIPASLRAMAVISRSGRKIGVATNQRGVALGLYDLATLDSIHEKMRRAVLQQGGAIDALCYCPHDEDENCLCRKPRPGMLLSLLDRLDTSPQKALMVGDRLSDLQAAWAAKIQPALVLTGYGQITLHHHQHELGDTQVFADLAAVALALQAGTL